MRQVTTSDYNLNLLLILKQFLDFLKILRHDPDEDLT